MALLLVLLFDLLLLSFLFHIHIYIQTDRQKDRQTDRQTDTQTHRHTDRRIYVRGRYMFVQCLDWQLQINSPRPASPLESNLGGSKP